MSNPQGRNEDLHHAHTNGASIPELSRRTLIPEYTLRCIMEHETCTDCGGPDAELHSMPQLHDVLGGRRE